MVAYAVNSILSFSVTVLMIGSKMEDYRPGSQVQCKCNPEGMGNCPFSCTSICCWMSNVQHGVVWVTNIKASYQPLHGEFQTFSFQSGHYIWDLKHILHIEMNQSKPHDRGVKRIIKPGCADLWPLDII